MLVGLEFIYHNIGYAMMCCGGVRQGAPDWN